MIIKLEYPFKEVWAKGYIVTNKEPRRQVVLFNSESNRTTISYARYLMSVKLERFLTEDEHVDHIDNDRLNDVIENLQILTKAANNIKATRQRYAGVQKVRIKCPTCKEVFVRRRGLTQVIPSLKGKVSCCSKKCRDILLTKKLSKEERDRISESSVVEVFTEEY